ncbi:MULTISPECIES: SMP-30/gluconolactonase/LRE family protein [Cryobacterium]|uniref:SMP-30/gluconolactonase/LRE family protein n=1 Tax=Cryobacterium breve TaxID=1259258 RepID=A0ABY2IZE5_9MICO|nr:MULTISPECIES: SMP-30/gluconolactonase/LRE family protein [Cryobacterium]TFC96919.1 SMP-30/gluconolactonase/LRE family protein [Cryobacterium sp. TmT3-12]TFC97285.1 SMP-30/gluconolactonase/LRE family protein [Cryobacterium breve]
MHATQRTDPVAFHGEGPVWSESWGGLRWVDLYAGDVLSLQGDTVSRRHVGSIAAALRPRRSGGAVIALESGFALEDAAGTITDFGALELDPGLRMNDGGCDPHGRFYCGTMAYDQSPGAARLYRLDPDGTVTVVLEGLTISNGLEWSPDGSLAYFNDTPSGRIAVLDYCRESGLTGLRRFAEIPSEDGFPDGLTVDSEGGVWVALYGGSAVRRYTPDGRLDGIVDVGATNVTACTFGGKELKQLIITTTRENLRPGQDPLAGSLFVADVGVAGRPVRKFAG